jgi:hypothetical protein
LVVDDDFRVVGVHAARVTTVNGFERLRTQLEAYRNWRQELECLAVLSMWP